MGSAGRRTLSPRLSLRRAKTWPLEPTPAKSLNVLPRYDLRLRRRPLSELRSGSWRTSGTKSGSGRRAAAEKVPELLLDEPRQPFSVSQKGGLRAERLEVIDHDLVEQSARCAGHRGS